MFISMRRSPLQGIARAACLFALVFSILALPGCDSDDPPEERETLRLVIFTGDETEAGAVVASLEQAAGEKAEVSRLFPGVDPDDDPDALAQMFLAIIPQGKALSESSWDRAYELRDATDYSRVEPDAEYTLEAASAAKAHGNDVTVGCCSVAYRLCQVRIEYLDDTLGRPDRDQGRFGRHTVNLTTRGFANDDGPGSGSVPRVAQTAGVV